jgi:hypothetical protein
MQAQGLVPCGRFLLAAALLSGLAAAQSPPICLNGGPYVVECTGPVTLVALDGTASFDPDGTPVTFFWFDECAFGSFEDPTDPQTNFIMDNTGVCVRVCNFVLRVTSGGQTTPCLTNAKVQDTTAPLMTCPPDIVEVWTNGPANGQTDPNLTGFATAVDCDPAPVIGFSDVFTPGTQPGDPETVVTRTWTGTDFCLNQSNCIQTITLLSPSGNLGARMDSMPGSCPNAISINGNGVLTMIIYGTSSFDASQINRTSLALQRSNNLGGVVRRVSSRLLDKGRPGANVACACGSNVSDGRLDLQITFDYVQVAQELQVLAELPGTPFEFVVTGRLNSGKWFTLRDCVSVQP